MRRWARNEGSLPTLWFRSSRAVLGASALALFLMFGPVLWLVMSSFKTEAALSEFPPRLLPYGQKAVAVPGDAGKASVSGKTALATPTICGVER